MPYTPNMGSAGGAPIDKQGSISADELGTTAFWSVNCLMRSLNAHTASTFIWADVANWQFVSQSSVPTAYVPSSIIPAGFMFYDTVTAAIYKSNSTRTTGAAFDITEKPNWTRVTGGYQNNRTITANTAATNDDDVIIVDTSAAEVMVSLPLTLSLTKRITFHKLVASLNPMTVTGTILKASTNSLGTADSFYPQYTTITYVNMGTYWAIAG